MSTKNIIFITIAIIFISGIVWIGGKGKVPNPPVVTENKTATTTENRPVEKAEVKPISNSTKSMTTAIITTNKGAITIEFFAATKPKTVENFITLAKKGFYNGTRFHRVIKGFMVQGGDPLSKDTSKMSAWGTGGPGYQFADEIGADNKNVISTIAMANSGPNTNGSQFFINVTNNNFLDTKHTVFARVTAGMSVVTAIENTKTGPNDRPIEDMIIEKIEVR